MRLWIGPRNEMIDLDDEDMPHSLFVGKSPETFGLRKDPVDRHLAETLDDGDGTDFDYDTLIVMAEMNGWVRVARDARDLALAVSASSVADARRALRLLDGITDGKSFAVEIERLEGETVVRSLHNLSPEEAWRFSDRGVLSPTRSYSTPVSAPSLLEAMDAQPALVM